MYARIVKKTGKTRHNRLKKYAKPCKNIIRDFETEVKQK